LHTLTFALSDRQTCRFRHLRQGRQDASVSGLAWYDTLKTTGNRVSYTLDSTLESVNTAEEAAVQMAGKAGFKDEDRDRISMAVREAAVNAVLHGNAYDPQKKMRVSFENTADSLVIKIADEGRGLKHEDIPDPLAPENLLKQSGRGIFLMRTFMDDVQFRLLQPGTEITLIKHVRSDADRMEDTK
jgi:serine/threonine-protein kinase RsbW